MLPGTQISVLGGSSPFTAAFIDALVPVARRLPACELVFHGRDTNNLELVAGYGRHRLAPYGWQVAATTDQKSALAGSAIVVHQIRYGGMNGRERDETVATRFGSPADETLGPGALNSILRTLAELKKTGRDMVENCPDAWILNLTNPLSLVTAVLIDAGVRRCVGLCELPLVTARQACEVLGLPFEQVEWSYSGLNHRGFVTELRYSGRNRIEELPGRLGTRDIGGIGGGVIAELGALPTKYFRIFSGQERPATGRAAYLDALREEIAGELRRNPEASPPGLRKRYLEWYPQSVVPMIAALLSEDATLQTVNIPGPDGVVEELQAWVSSRSFEPRPVPEANDAVGRWLAIFRSHEEAMLRCVRAPGLQTIAGALLADPVVDPRNVDAMAEVLWASYDQHSSAEVCVA
jgi:6-phospho-beta-glucosidase